MKQTILIIALLAFAGCKTPAYVTNWHQVQLGMTQDQVRNLLGEPHQVSAPMPDVLTPEIKVASTNDKVDVAPVLATIFARELVYGLFDKQYERWRYGGESFFILGSPKDAFIVYFDQNGKVNGFRRPTEGRYSNLNKEDKKPDGASLLPASNSLSGKSTP